MGATPNPGAEPVGGGVSEDAAQASDDEGRLALAVALTSLAGFVDAVAFVRFGGLFVSFMSGNTTEMAALPSQGRIAEAAAAAGVIALFVMGAFAGRLLAQSAGAWRRPALLSVVAGLLATSAVAVSPGAEGPALTLGVAALALAMGLQNSVLRQAGGAKVTLTYVTGTLVNLGHGLADAVLGQGSVWGSYLLMWLGLVGGAALGALGATRYGALALVAPAAAAALLALVLGGLVRRGGPRRAS